MAAKVHRLLYIPMILIAGLLILLINVDSLRLCIIEERVRNNT